MMLVWFAHWVKDVCETSRFELNMNSLLDFKKNSSHNNLLIYNIKWTSKYLGTLNTDSRKKKYMQEEKKFIQGQNG